VDFFTDRRVYAIGARVNTSVLANPPQDSGFGRVLPIGSYKVGALKTEDRMRSFCQRCGKPRHIVGGRAVMRSENGLDRDGVTIVETIRRVVEGQCDVCGATLNRLVPGTHRGPVETVAAEAGSGWG
jgi:hypothetical protein